MRRAAVLDAIEPMATACLNGSELRRLGLIAGQTARLQPFALTSEVHRDFRIDHGKR